MDGSAASVLGRVLVVDDDDDMLESVCEVLADAGYGVDRARNGAEALKRLSAAAPPDLILLDLMMPVMDGYAFRAEQRTRRELVGIPTIALTAGAVDERIAALELSGWLRKPITVGTLLAAVDRNRRQGHAVAPEHSVQFYRDPAELADAVVWYLRRGFDAGDGALVIATAEHWELIATRLAAAGVDPIAALTRSQLVFAEARLTLDAFVVDGQPDEARFREVVVGLLGPVQERFARIRGYGEMVDLLWQAGDIAGALALETFWNRLLYETGCPLHCAYSSPRTPEQDAGVDRVRDHHAHVLQAIA